MSRQNIIIDKILIKITTIKIIIKTTIIKIKIKNRAQINYSYLYNQEEH